jgi:transposase
MRYIKGLDRHQSILLPDTVDQYVDENNPVRFMEVFVDSLDLKALGFTKAITKETGRKPYNPSDMLKLYIYGYLNKIRSSRELEKATYRNIEVIWLMRKLRPDFKTIADFRKDNSKALKGVFRQFTLFCKSMDLFGCELIAIDGSKFSAVNHNGRNYTRAKLNKILKAINKEIDDYLHQLERQDKKESDIQQPNEAQLQQKIDDLKQRLMKFQQLQQQIDASGDSQISLTDSDSRMMKTNKGNDVSYNVEIATDDKHKLIADFDVTNAINDRNQFSNMAIKAKDVLDVPSLKATGDAGFHNETEVAICEQNQITCYIPKPKVKSTEGKDQLYSKADFSYDSDADCYICPANKKLNYSRQTNWKKRKNQKVYLCADCKNCTLRPRCMGDKRGNRYIRRGINEHLIEEMEQRVKENPYYIKKRKELVEHPFGTIKHWMDQGYFLTRGFEKVTGEMSLTMLCYNIKRVLNIFDVKELINMLKRWSIDHYFLFQLKYLGSKLLNLVKIKQINNSNSLTKIFWAKSAPVFTQSVRSA